MYFFSEPLCPGATALIPIFVENIDEILDVGASCRVLQFGRLIDPSVSTDRMEAGIGPSRGGQAAASSMQMIWKMPTIVMLLQLLVLLTHSLRQVQSEVYMVVMDDSPVVHYDGSIPGYGATEVASNAKLEGASLTVRNYAAYLRDSHDIFLATSFPEKVYTKLYSYTYVVNGFAVDITTQQAGELSGHPRVKRIEADSLVKKATTHSPDYLKLPGGAWHQVGGTSIAGEDIVIGLVDTGINPAHPSFANVNGSYGPLSSYWGYCEEATEFPAGSCNNKLIGARHFAAAAIAVGAFNASVDFASPLDGDGHGTHTASTSGGNHGVPVEVDGLYFGQASGIAPRARVAMYKALYRSFGGYFADVVAAIDQAAADGVDILSLSIAPGIPPKTNAVYFNTIDIALLGVVRAGIFVVQAAGNNGPSFESILSFSPWIVSAAASYMDRNYSNSITLGNGKILSGDGLAAGTPGSGLYTIVSAKDVNVSDYPQVLVEECQSSDYFDKKLVQGNLLVCTYTIDFLFGNATLKRVSDTAKNLSAAGIIYVVSDDLVGLEGLYTILDSQGVPAIVLDSARATEAFHLYYNTSTKTVDRTTTFGAKAKLNGGISAIYTGAAPVVASFSSRGPDFNNVSYIPADVLKPNLMAPGVSIWAGWSPIGVDDRDFLGENFAIISGTSMATPHIAGIAALVKQKNPSFSPAAIHSALAGTAFSVNKNGAPLQAEYPDPNDLSVLIGPASPFDLGAGQVDALPALDPGLIFEAGIEDYIKFLCIIPTANSSEVLNTTGSGCPSYLGSYPSDLNTPYISIGVLNGSRAVPRTVTSVVTIDESYSVKIDSPKDILSSVKPTSFNLHPGQSQTITVTLVALRSANGSFGQLHFFGSQGHSVSIPITVAQKFQ